jgi:hypothetical protein
MAEPQETTRSLSDAAIRSADQDRFRRGPIASRIAAEARVTSADGGNVIAICGPWGSGKTSIANMAMEELRADPSCVVMHFNPWTFFGADDLIFRFFVELSKTLGQRDGRLRAVAERLAGYAGALSGVVKAVPGIGGAGELLLNTFQQLTNAASGDGPTLDDQRELLVEALKAYEGRIVVFLDDIDRLTDDEIRAVVRLVKVVGDLPRLSYVLAFDKARVEQVLGAPETDAKRAQERGRAYLEKIVQSEHNVPMPRYGALWEFVRDQLLGACSGYDAPAEDDEDWTTIMLALVGRIQTPREAKRVANSVAAGLYLYSREIAVVDIVMLEALRTLESEVHAWIPRSADLLTSGLDGAEDRDQARARLQTLVSAARSEYTAKALLGNLFPAIAPELGNGRPATTTERRDRRVADGNVLSTYIHASISDDQLSADLVEHLVDLLDSPEEFGAALANVSEETFSDAVVRLLDYRENFPAGQGNALAVQILRSAGALLVPDTSDDRGTPLSVTIKSLVAHDTGTLQANAIKLFDAAPSLSARYAVLRWFGTGEPIGPDDEPEDLGELDEDVEAKRYEVLANEVEDISPDELIAEPAMVELLEAAVAIRSGNAKPIADKLEDDRVMLRLLAELPTVRFDGRDGPVERMRLDHVDKAFGLNWLKERIERLMAPETFDALEPEDAARVRLAHEAATRKTARTRR